MAKKNGRDRARNWQGSKWERSDGRWGAELPYLEADGSTGYLTTTRRDEDAVDRWLNKKRYERDEGLLLSLDAERTTLGEYLDRWLKDSLAGTVSRHTYRDYEDKVRLHINPTLGRKKLKDLNRMDLQALYRRKTREGLSPRTVRYIHTTLSKALGEAEASDLVRKNVAKHAKPPKPGHSERDAMEVDEVKTFLRAIRQDRFEALYLLAVTTGLRRGELVGLKWADLELDAKPARMKVLRSLDTAYGPAVENDPKRRASERPAILLPVVVDALKRHKAGQREDRLRAGPRWQENGYVFPTKYGTPQRADNILARSLKPLCERAGLRPLNFQDLRHSCATFLALLGIHPKTAQRILGHSSIATTLNVYTHALDEMHEDAAEKLGELLFGPENGDFPVALLSKG